MATTAEEAWQKLQGPACDVTVVITDAVMPGRFDGMELLDRIVALERDVDVIVMSGQGDQIASRSVKHGSYDFIAKPLVKDLLVQKIDNMVQHRKLELQVESDRQAKAAMMKAIDELSERALHTPVQVVAESVGALLKKSDLTPDLRADVEALRKLIVQSSNMYRPFTGQPNVDPISRSFLLNELSLYVPEPEFTQTFPRIPPEDPVTYELTQWAFNVFKRPEDELLALVKQMFLHLDLLVHFNIRVDVLERFIGAVRQLYKPVPYHNWIHAVDTAQAAFCFLVQFGGFTKLSRLDWLALLVASLCHDLGHPGVNNAHMVFTQSELALLYNDRSVLENFHAASLFQLLRRDDVNIFASLTRQQLRDVRKSITDCILSTDMADHYEYVTRLGVKADLENLQWSSDVANDRLLLMKCVVKMADISNVARPWDVSVEWARRLSEEFFAQGKCYIHFSSCAALTGKNNFR